MTMSGVVLAPYSPAWPVAFERERALIAQAFAPIAISLEHIGSTSVPGLTAKPVLDLLLGAESLAAIEERIAALGELGYAYVSKYERELPSRRYFVKSAGESPRVHLHAVVRGARLWIEHLAFRDSLRTDPLRRSAYEALKLRLAAELAHDKAAYTAAKGPFIEAALAQLLAK
jgi:GrpB-like predicted nucleotidyltransferase (UPF0157 family)